MYSHLINKDKSVLKQLVRELILFGSLTNSLNLSDLCGIQTLNYQSNHS